VLGYGSSANGAGGLAASAGAPASKTVATRHADPHGGTDLFVLVIANLTQRIIPPRRPPRTARKVGDPARVTVSEISADCAPKEALINPSTLTPRKCRCPKDEAYRIWRPARVVVNQRIPNERQGRQRLARARASMSAIAGGYDSSSAVCSDVRASASCPGCRSVECFEPYSA
jgi:hypothetical protein